MKRAVIVAMVAMRMMQPAIDQIVKMVAMGDRFMAAAGSVGVPAAARFGSAVHGVRVADLDHMLVDVAFMRVMQMAVLQVIDMIPMANGNVSAVRAMLMGGCCHDWVPLQARGELAWRPDFAMR
jgi:hypothetical protein